MSDVEAGKAHVKTYVDNSTFVKGLKQAESVFAGFGNRLASIGKGISVTVSGFGFLAKIIPAIAGFLASPLGIVVAIAAAVAGGVYAWVRFTESGKAAAKFLLDFFGPAIQFIKQLVGGIG